MLESDFQLINGLVLSFGQEVRIINYYHMKKAFVLGVVVVFALSSCQKDEDQAKSKNNLTTTASTADIKVPAGFDWKTTRLTTLRIEGSEHPFTEKRRIVVKTMDGREIISRHVRMNEDADIKFELPIAYEQLTVEYGAIVKIVDVNNGLATFDFVPAEDPVNTNDDSENPQPEEELIKVEEE